MSRGCFGLTPTRWFALFLYMLAAAGPRAAESQCSTSALFLPAVFHATGAAPHDVATADFNEDGFLDVAVVNSGAHTVSILLGTGNGGLSAPVSYATASGPFGIAIGDFNEDGIADIVTSNLTANNVSVLRGHGSGGIGDGTFASHADFAAGSNPFDVAIGDFNIDGIADLAVTNNGTGGFSRLLGQGSGGVGNGGFGAPQFFMTGTNPTGIVVGDFDEDGLEDLAITNYGSHTVSIARGLGGPFFVDPPMNTGTSPFGIAIGDFNENGILDLVTANSGSSDVAVMLGLGAGGDGNGTFGLPSPYPTGSSPNVVGVADFNGDGISDLATSNAISDDISILLGSGTGGTGNGSFGGPQSFSTGDFPIALTIADLDGNGRQDIIVANYQGGGVSVLLGRCLSVGPVLTDVRDVPNDQGGRVFLTWLRSELDAAGSSTITGYRVWRRIPPEAAAASSPARPIQALSVSRPDGTMDVTYWEALISLPAEHLEGYGYTAPTTQDSLKNSNPYTAFFVAALTEDPFVFFSSNIDSGYSVDNRGPKKPHDAMATLTESGVALIWNSTDDSDLLHYRVYRGTDDTFAPSEENLVASPADTFYLDASGMDDHVYKISAVDLHGNESEYVVAYGSSTTDVVNTRASFALHGASPNPTRGDLVVECSLPDARPARLELIDIHGRRAWSRDITASAGRQTIRVTGAQLPAGIYLLRLVQNDRFSMAKVAVIR